MKKNTSYKVQVSAGTLILAMRDYFQARRDGRTEEMEAQLRLAEACVNDMEEEDFWDESENMYVNVPKWYN